MDGDNFPLSCPERTIIRQFCILAVPLEGGWEGRWGMDEENFPLSCPERTILRQFCILAAPPGREEGGKEADLTLKSKSPNLKGGQKEKFCI